MLRYGLLFALGLVFPLFRNLHVQEDGTAGQRFAMA
jgi:hypothetical protein